MDGGTVYIQTAQYSKVGLSPRGRGNRFQCVYINILPGSIPAWTGEPARMLPTPRMIRVYPRVDGGTWYAIDRHRFIVGLSPRGRGNRPLRDGHVAGHRSIPAWTGEPTSSRCRPPMSAVYPRVDGGTPRSPATPPTRYGLSPRGRGNRTLGDAGKGNRRSIPAWTGEPALGTRPASAEQVYPRVDGGTSGDVQMTAAVEGLSPRGRGNLLADGDGKGPDGSIPAWTGEPGPLVEVFEFLWVYPRVDGGTPPAGPTTYR